MKVSQWTPSCFCPMLFTTPFLHPHHQQISAGYPDDTDVREGLENIFQSSGGERQDLLRRICCNALQHRLERSREGRKATLKITGEKGKIHKWTKLGNEAKEAVLSKSELPVSFALCSNSVRISGWSMVEADNTMRDWDCLIGAICDCYKESDEETCLESGLNWDLVILK